MLLVVVLSMMLASMLFAACGEKKKKCHRCGKTEDETELYLFDTSNHPCGDGNYYCGGCYRYVFSTTSVPTVKKEIERIANEEE